MPDERLPDRSWTYGEDPDQVADVYLPRADAAPRSMVVIVHGGFWRKTYDRAHVRPLCASLADRGHVVASLEYRRRPGDPDATMADIRSAIRALPALRESLELHDGEVQLIGHSAGGQLVLWLVAEPDVTATVVALAPVADLVLAETLDLGGGAVPAFLGIGAVARADLDPARRRVPRAGVTIVHGAQDDVVPLSISESYVAAMDGAARLVAIPGCGHFEPIDPQSQAWPTLIDELDRLVDGVRSSGY